MRTWFLCWSGRPPWWGPVNPLQYSCLENPMDREAWPAMSLGLQRIRHDWSDLAHTMHKWHLVIFFKGFSGGSECKESACKARDLGSIPGLERSPGGGHGNSLQHSCLENPHGQRSLVGYSSWGCKESLNHMTEWLSTAQFS